MEWLTEATVRRHKTKDSYMSLALANKFRSQTLAVVFSCTNFVHPNKVCPVNLTETPKNMTLLCTLLMRNHVKNQKKATLRFLSRSAGRHDTT